MSLSHAFAQLSTVGCNSGFTPSSLSLPQLSAAQEAHILNVTAAAFLAGGAAVVLHALTNITAFG